MSVAGGDDDEHPEGEDDDEHRTLGYEKTVLSDINPRADAGTVKRIWPEAMEKVRDGQAPTLEAVAATLVSPEGPQPKHMPSPVVELGRVLGGRYTLDKLLGAGGMGQVWKGQHLKLGIPIAVKTMHPHVAAQRDYVRRFQREAHAASVLNHPNVVRVLDFGDEGGLLYLVMEFLEGQSLAGYLDKRRMPPPLAEIEPIVLQLFDAFSAAHALGIVHRDLKPDNVFLTKLGDLPLVKVVDFGLAHVDDVRDKGPTLTSQDVVAGTPEYMSPEQCRSLAVGPSADLYSLGCVLTELLQLRPPFRGATAIDVIARHMFSPPPPLDRPADAEPVPPLLERLRMDLLAKVPEKRPKDPSDAKARFVEAMSLDATALRLPTRKGDEPLGDRAMRGAAYRIAPKVSEAPPRIGVASIPPRNEGKHVGLMRVADTAAGGVGAECETGLASIGLLIDMVSEAGEIAQLGLTALILDAGADHEAARKKLIEIQKGAPACRVVVCAASLTTERMNTLVGAGAADVVRYPVTPDALGKKIERVLRRGR